jgi:stress-induced-phosphoprotein 1
MFHGWTAANLSPAVQILSDPVMQSILQQAKSDPAALNEHMKNPGIRAKIQKLIAAGVIRVGR